MFKNIFSTSLLLLITLIKGGANLWKWLMALLDVLGVFTYPNLSAFAFSGLCSGFFLSIISYPTHGWDRLGFWVGAVFGVIAIYAAFWGVVACFVNNRVHQESRRLRTQDLHV